MKTLLQAATLLLLVFGLVAYAAEPHPSTLPVVPSVKFTQGLGLEKVQMGSSLNFGFEIHGIESNLFYQPILKKDGKPIGELTYYKISLLRATNGDYTGSFCWDLTRVIAVSNAVTVWPKAGQYSVYLGAKVLRGPLKGVIQENFDAFTETEKFELVGTPPPLFIRKGNIPGGVVVVYVSGEPGDRFTLQYSPPLWYGFFVWGDIQSFEIGPEGLHATGIDTMGGGSGFFRTRKNN